MAELDKKIQKALTDLVQAVLEAQEKKNLERVDMLITNAIKQLKMSRFKPDQATCISLIYLSRLKPKIFSQSSAIKEVLKGLLRRDNGPSNIKGKNDIFLPILSANILLASCDSLEVRTLVLSKIEQWLSSNQKPTDQIQHLLAVLCIKCLNDKQTIATLVDMRHNWLQYLEDNYDLYGSVPEDLCSSIRRLLPFESSSEYLIVYLKFLIKHDSDIISLGKELSKFVNERPMSLDCMLKEQEHGGLLVKMIMKVFIKLIAHLKKSHLGNATGEQNRSVEETKKQPTATKESPVKKSSNAETIVIELEPVVKEEPKVEKAPEAIPIAELKKETKPKVKSNVNESPNHSNDQSNAANGNSSSSNSTKCADEDSSSNLAPEHATAQVPPLYVRLSNNSQVIPLDRVTIEAVLSLLASVESNEEFEEEFFTLLECWISKSKNNQHEMTSIYFDANLTSSYSLSNKLRQKLIHSSNDQLIEFGLRHANVAQLVNLLHQFGTSTATISKILKNLESIKDVESIKSEIRDISYFNQLMEFYSNSLGESIAGDLQRRLEQIPG